MQPQDHGRGEREGQRIGDEPVVLFERILVDADLSLPEEIEKKGAASIRLRMMMAFSSSSRATLKVGPNIGWTETKRSPAFLIPGIDPFTDATSARSRWDSAGNGRLEGGDGVFSSRR
jgi:hypothetical protein